MGILGGNDIERLRESERELLKETLNSTIGTAGQKALDKHLLDTLVGGEVIFRKNGTFTVPQGVYCIRVIAAGGGGGGYAGSRNAGGPGGSGGCCIDEFYNVASGTVINITVGAGGAGYLNLNNSSANGGTTVVGNLVTVAGGNKGYSPKASSAGAGSGAGGYYVSSEAQTTDGEDGLYGFGGGGTSRGFSGAGGGGSYGEGGNGGQFGVTGRSGTDGGGGGGGGATSSSSSYIAGGKGGDGIVIIRWGMRANGKVRNGIVRQSN